MDRLIEIKPEVDQTGSATIIQFTTSTGDGESFKLEFAVEELYQPSPLAVSEAMLLATIALAMQRKRALRVHGKISRSLRHSIDLYQEACSCWWPRRYCKVPIEVDIADDQPAATARGVLCFSGGLESIYSAHNLGAAKQIDTGLFVAGYDIDAGPGQYQQRDRVARLLDRLSLQMTVVSTNVRQVWIEVKLEQIQSFAKSGSCKEALSEANAIADPVDGFDFTKDGLDPFVKSTRTKYFLADAYESCGEKSKAFAIFEQLAPDSDPSNLIWAARSAKRLPGYDSSKWTDRLISAVPRAEQQAQRSNAKVWWFYVAGSMRKSAGQDEAGNIELRDALLLPDSRMAHHYIRLALAEPPQL